MKEYEEIIRTKGLPSVGQTVYSKKYGTLWLIVEKREVWNNIDPDPTTGEPRLIPAIYLAYWRIQEGVRPGVGRMMAYTYTLFDNTFEANWEILPGDNLIYPKGWLEENQGAVKVIEFPMAIIEAKKTSKKQKDNTLSGDHESQPTMGKVIDLRLTRKAVYRAAVKEINKMYRLSAGGAGPIIYDASRFAFERGEIDEVIWIDWPTYCELVLNNMQNTIL